MPLLDRLTEEAFKGLCPDCPQLSHAQDVLADRGDVMLIPRDDEHEIFASPDNPIILVGRQVTMAAGLTATLMLKEELGCDGAFTCPDCDELHCGAHKKVTPEVQHYIDIDELQKQEGI